MKLHNEDCIVQMQKMIDEGIQVDSIVTDPPYALNFMGKSWDSTGIAFQKKTWELAFQLLKPGGHLLAFAGSRTYHRIAVAIEDAGFEIRDQIMWLYGSGFPKSLNIGKSVDKKLGAKRKVIGKKFGKGGENLNKLSRENKGDSEDAKGCGAYGTGAKQKSIGKTTVQGRYPANVMHDGLEQEWARYFYCPKVSKNERNRGLDDFEEKKTSSMSGRRDPHDMGKSKIDNDVTGRFVTERKNIHPTVKPVELMKYLCRLVTPKGGTVLDPFMGSGTTGMAAKDEGFEFIGIEKEKEYYEIAEQRINTTSPLLEFI